MTRERSRKPARHGLGLQLQLVGVQQFLHVVQGLRQRPFRIAAQRPAAVLTFLVGHHADDGVGHLDRDAGRADAVPGGNLLGMVDDRVMQDVAEIDLPPGAARCRDGHLAPGQQSAGTSELVPCRRAGGWQADQVRVAIRVRPGSSRTVVGGSHDGALVIKVGARAVDGKATAAALRALAEAIGVHHRDVLLISGATSRSKVVEIPDGHQDRVTALLAR